MLGWSRWLHRVRCSAPYVWPTYRGKRTFADAISTVSPIVREEAIRLRQYQEECIQSVLSYLGKGEKRLGVSLATGSGKTVIFTRLIDRVPAHGNNADQTLILAHRRELVDQAARHCEKAYPDKSIEIEMGETHASGAADITVASVRSLLSGDRLSKYDPARFKLVLVDEAHHVVAPGYLQVLDHFGLLEKAEDTPALVGVSATFSRFDGLRLGAAIDHIVYHKDYVDMIGEKWLSDVVFTTVKSHANLSKVKSSSDGDFQTKQLSEAVNTDVTNDITVTSWQAEASDRHSTLVFCVDIKHVETLTSKFRQAGVDAQYITGATKKSIRADRLQAFKNREFPVLLNCGVFTEGTDIPNVDCVLLARPTKSRNLLVQMIGRGMRLYPGKANCHIIDMVASLETGIVTVPTLFGLDPSEIVKEAKPSDLKDLKDKQDQELSSTEEDAEDGRLADLSNHTLSFTHYSSVYDLIEDTSGERHVRSLSPNAWVQVDAQRYILTARGGILSLERGGSDASPSPTRSTPSSETKSTVSSPSTAGALYRVTYKHSLPTLETSKSPWSRPRTVATAATLSAALHAADTFAASKFERVSIVSSSAWRKTPASDTQLAFLNRLRAEQPWTCDDLSKGLAADMITKVKFGARGRFEKLMRRQRGVQKEVQKVERLRERETVRVGPLEE